MKKAILTILMGTAFAVASAQAETVFGNLGADGTNAISTSGGNTVSTNVWRAIGFTPSGANLVLNSATIGLETTTPGFADIRLDLYSNNAGVPGSSLFNTTLTLAGNTPAAPVTFSLNQTLTAGTTYFIVAQVVDGAASVFWRRPVATGVAPTAQNGSGWNNLGGATALQSLNSGSTWSVAGNGSGSAITLDAVPEPSTYALLLLTGAGALLWARRRRQA